MEVQKRSESSSSLENLSGPWLVFFCKSRKGRDQQVFYSPGEERYCIKSIFLTRDSICIPTSQGWILTMNPYDNFCCLQDPITATKIKLPRPMWDLTDYDCVLSSTPTNPKCKVLVADMEERKFLFCQPSDKQWTQFEDDLGNNNHITDITAFDDKFYGITLHKNLVIIDCPPNPAINILESIITEYPFGVDSFQTYILQSCGELFFLERYFDHSNKTVHIAIMKKDFSKQEWVSVDDIGDRAFLLGANNCTTVSCSSSEVDIKGNCIYYVEVNDGCLYCLDLEEGLISVHLPRLKSNVCNKDTPAVWMIPALCKGDV